MFWKKKQMAISPGTVETAGATPTAKEPPAKKDKVSKPKVEKLPGPRGIPDFVGKYLVAEMKMDPDLVPIYKIVVHKRPQTERAFDCRVFDTAEAEASNTLIKDYTSLDTHQELIIYEGWFDEASKRVELKTKRETAQAVPILTEAEILQKIQALSEPGGTVLFYQARGSAVGGPLGRGAVIVELNPNYPGKKGKKYIIYTANVVGIEPVAKREKLFDSDKLKDIAKWVKEGHHKRMY
jgi:hypothetical protein